MEDIKRAELIIEAIQARLIKVAQRRPFRFVGTERAEAEDYLARQVTFIGYSEEEIQNMQANLSVRLPTLFRAYLKKFGKARGDLFAGECTRPPTASLPSLVPRCGLCASGGG